MADPGGNSAMTPPRLAIGFDPLQRNKLTWHSEKHIKLASPYPKVWIRHTMWPTRKKYGFASDEGVARKTFGDFEFRVCFQ